MKRARSFVKLVWPSLGALLLVANCTVKSVDDTAMNCTPGATHACTCSNAASGSQVCQADGLSYAACQCSASGGSSNSSGGSTSGGSTAGGSTAGGSTSGGSASGGTSNASGGYTSPSAGQGGESGGTAAGGAGGAGGASALDVCDDCLLQKCGAELDACLSDPVCFTGDPDNPGQFEDVTTCIEGVRSMTPAQSAKRIDVVDCGILVGNNTNSFAWPPDGMAVTTTNLINCMATGMTNTPNNNSWAQGDPDVTTDPVSQKWADGTCAKTSCTSPL